MKLSERYPDINFLLNVTPHKPCRLPLRSKRLEKWFDAQSSEHLEILYIIGLIGYPLPESVSKWLEGSSERALIFVEPKLGAFHTFEDATMMANPQIHFVYGGEDVIETLAEQYPSERVAVYEGRPFDSFELKRRSAAYSALYSDVLYSHKIVENVLHNMGRLEGTFVPSSDLSSVPLIICGAGPSLEASIEVIAQNQNRALILAVGSGIAALTKRGITPHLAMALDPNDAEFDHLAQGRYFEGPFIFSPRLHRDVWATSNGPYGFLQSDTGGFIESYLEAQLGMEKDSKKHEEGPKELEPRLMSEAFSVTTLALPWASSVGFRNIALTGIDLAYTGGKRYASGIQATEDAKADLRTLDQVIKAKDIHGRPCETLTKWIMEANCIKVFAELHPEIQVVNCSMAGLGIENVPNIPMKKWVSKFPQQDIRGLVHQFTQLAPNEFDPHQYKELTSSLQRSLVECHRFSEEIPKQKSSGKKALLISDFHDEPAYEALLEGIDRSLEHLLVRYHPHIDPEQVASKRESARYEELKRQIALFSKIFDLLAKNQASSLL